MDLSQLRFAIPSRGHLYGGSRNIPLGVRFYRTPRGKPSCRRNLVLKLSKALEKNFLEYNLRFGSDRICVVPPATAVGRGLISTLQQARSLRLLEGRADELSRLVCEMARRHASCNYQRLYDSVFDSVPAVADESVVPSLELKAVLRFVRRCIRKVLPEGFFGSRKSFDEFLRSVLPRFFGHRFDQLGMAGILGGLDGTSMTDDSTTAREKPLFGRSYLLSIGWLISVYITPLIVTFFYITETLDTAGRLLVFPRSLYLDSCSKEVERLVVEGALVRVTSRSHGPEGFGLRLRFYPKPNGSWRMICAFRRADKMGRIRMVNLKKKLNPALKEILKSSKNVVSSTSEEIFRHWISTVINSRAAGKKLYFIKVDVAGAYPNMKPDVLRDVLERYLKPARSSLFTAAVNALEQTRVCWGPVSYKMSKGVPQGAFPMSALLCDLYYAHVLTVCLPDFQKCALKDGEVFLRYLDDILFASTDPDRIRRFLAQAREAASLPFEMKLNVEKTVSNVPPVGLEETYKLSESFVFCGSRLDSRVPRIYACAPEDPAVYVRCPMFTRLRVGTSMSCEEVVQSYLKSRSSVMNHRAKWKWHFRDHKRADQKSVLTNAMQSGFRHYIRIVSKTSAFCFGSEAAIWRTYPEVLLNHFMVVAELAVRLYCKNSRSIHGCWRTKDVLRFARSSLLEALKTTSEKHTSLIATRVRRMSEDDLAKILYLDAAKASKERDNRRVAQRNGRRVLQALQEEVARRAPNVTLTVCDGKENSCEPASAENEAEMNPVMDEVADRLSSAPVQAAERGGFCEVARAEGSIPLVDLTSPETFIVNAAVPGKKRSRLRKCVLCEARLKSDGDVQKHLDGRLHRERVAGLTGSPLPDDLVRKSSFVPVVNVDAMNEALVELDRRQRVDAETCLKYSSAGGRIIQRVSLASRSFGCMMTRGKISARIVKVGHMAHSYWPKMDTETECVLLLNVPMKSKQLKEFISFLGNEVTRTAEGASEEFELTKHQNGCQFSVRSCQVLELSLKFTVVSKKMDDSTAAGRIQRDALKLVDREQWLERNMNYATSGNGDVVYSSYEIARMMRRITAPDPCWNVVSLWEFNVIVVRSLQRERRALKLGEVIRIAFAFVVWQFDSSNDRKLMDPLDRRVLIPNSVDRELIRESAQAFVGHVDSGKMAGMLAPPKRKGNKRKLSGDTEDSSSKRGKLDPVASPSMCNDAS